jgi:hypothetical protein
MHKEAHNDVPTRIIEVDVSVVESFLGRIEDPDTELNIINESAFRFIMVAELKNTALPKTYPAAFSNSLKNFCNEAADVLHTHRGSIVEKTDFLFLVSFKSVTDAVNAAFEISRLFSQKNVRIYRRRNHRICRSELFIQKREHQLLF